jgi:hypothetical protein
MAISRKDVIKYLLVRNFLEEETKRIFDYILKVIPKKNENAQEETLRSWRIDGKVLSLLYSYVEGDNTQPIMASFELPIASVIDGNWKRWLDIQAQLIEEQEEDTVPPTTEGKPGSDYDLDKESIEKQQNNG